MSAPAQEPPAAPAWSRRSRTLTVAVLALVVLTCLAFVLPVPYSTMRPGPAINTLGDFDDKPLIDFGDGVKTYRTTGTLDFTTVSVSRQSTRLSLVGAVQAYFADDTTVVPRDLLYPDGQTQEQATQQSAAQLTSSKDTSTVAALRALGKKVPSRVLVATVVKGGASEGVLREGDVVRRVDGEAVSEPQQVVEAVSSRKPGQDVVLDVTRKGKDERVTVTTKPSEDGSGRAVVGVALTADYDLPVKVTNNVGHEIGGPSAGTMFALAIYDKLTPGSLTGGRDVAGTGTISVDGTVGSIGGIQQKIAGAARAGATLFLVPAANCAEALEGDDHGLDLVRITTLKDAISSLETLADDPKATVPTCR